MELVAEKYKKTEIGIIPKDWELRTLGEVGEVKMCRRIFNNETSSSGSVPFFKIGTFGKEPDAYISRDQYENYRKRFSFPRKGDILISAAGTIGRTIVYNGEDAYFQDSNIVWIENDFSLVSNEFLYHLYQVVKYNTEGGTIQRLYNSILKAAKFACPPKCEQTAIATALSDMDTLISQTEKLIEKKKAIKQGVMQELLRPKDDWVTKKLGEVANCFAGGTPSTFKRDFWGGNIPWLPSGRVKNNIIKPIEDEITITDLGLSSSAAKMIKPNSILIAITGATCGNIGLLTYSAAANQSVVAIEKNDEFDSVLMYYILLTMRDDILRLQTGSAQGGVNLKAVKALEVIIPEKIGEQNEISQILWDFDKEIESYNQKLTKLKLQKQGMMQALLTGKIRLV
ncbi:MAG: hypothetical protein RL092_433 [Bacteroidota bacterium]|jgi:type I restriction enzyme S subunit